MIPTDTSASVGDSFFSEIGDALRSGLDSGSETTDTQVDAAPLSDSGTEETPGGEAPTPIETVPGDASTPPGEAPTSEYKLNEDGSAYLIPKDQFPALNGFKQYATELQGIFPTVNDAKAANTESSDLRAMYTDYISGNEGDVKKFVDHFAGANADPSIKAQYEQAFVRMSQEIPGKLKQVNPEAYSKFSGQFVTESVNNAYKQAEDAQAYASQSGMPSDQEYADLMLKQAQYLDWGVTGQYKAELPKHDPVKAEQERLAAERADFDKRVSTSMARDFDSYNKTSVDGPKWNQYWGEIDKTLAPIKDKYDPKIFEAVKQQISREVIQSLETNYDWARTHGNERKAIEAGYKDLWQKQQPATSLQPRVQVYHTDFLAQVRRILPSIAAPLINKATATAVASKTAAPRAKTPPAPRSNAPATPQAEKPGFYSPHDDPEFAKLFKVSQ